MADKYQIAIGHNMAGSLQDVVPQPRMPGIKKGRRTPAGDGLIKDDGLENAVWLYGYQTPDQLTDFMAAAGIGRGTPSAYVTVRMPQNEPVTGARYFRNYNATIVMPDMPDEARYEATVYQELQFRLIYVDEI